MSRGTIAKFTEMYLLDFYSKIYEQEHFGCRLPELAISNVPNPKWSIKKVWKDPNDTGRCSIIFQSF